MSTNNKLMPIPFADKAGETYKYSIPNTNDTTYPNKATYENGFPAVTMTDIAAGGVPPFGQDFNGVLNDITTAIRYMQAGNYQLYNSDFATSIGGYSKGAVILGSDSKLYESTIDSNTNDPISGTGWTLHLNYLPLTGGTLSGDLTAPNITANTSLTVGSAKATYSATGLNFDKPLLINGAAVLKVGDGGVATTALKVLPDFKSLSNNSGTYIAYGSKVPNLATPNVPSGTGNSKLTVTVRCDGTVSHYEVIENAGGNPKKWVGECYTSSGSLVIYWAEVVTTANVSSYVTPNVEYWYVNGSEASPATITTNQEIVIDNPYYGKSVSLIPQAYITGRDGTSRWIDCPFNYENSNSNGVSVNQIESNLYILGANNYIFYSSKLNTGLPSGILPSGELKSAQFRIKIIK